MVVEGVGIRLVSVNILGKVVRTDLSVQNG